MGNIVIFCLERIPDDILRHKENNTFKLVHWMPGIKHGLRPKRFPFKYNIFWFYHFFRIFKNKNYSSFLLYDGDLVVSALLVIPTYYRWTFMANSDVQLTYVITHPEYRGKGLAKQIIKHALKHLKSKKVKRVWYVTEQENTASIKLCESMGFRLVGTGIRKHFFNGLIKILYLKPKRHAL